jgi:outer membrane protein insertion porin family
MNMKKYYFLLIILLSLVAKIACAADTFIVRNIEIQGLQRISPDTVYTYLPVKKGETLRADQSAAVIQTLYKTGFFERISLGREGNTLIISVVERPTIGQLKVSGNKVIPTDKLTSVMKSVDVAEGRVFNQLMLEKIRQSLLNQYYELGRYNARVEVTVKPMERNRVLVKIDISEGLVATIRHINIIGNHAFTEDQLKKQLTMTPPGLFTFFTDTDRYSQEKLDQSLDNLRNFYLDHGYVRFSIESSQVEITPDRKSIYVTIAVKEGAQYKIKGYELLGDFILPKEDLLKLIKIKPGTTFSRQTLLDSEKAITDALGDKGYLFATVSINPKIDDINKEVYLTFTVKPGKRVYVRHINFVNNNKSNDLTLRREMSQMEASLVSTGKLDESKRNLNLLPYIKEVQMSVVPVPGKDDQVDVDYKVTEESAGQINFSVGYSQAYHVLLGIGFNQKNFLGTGKTLGVNLTRSQVEQDYAISYFDPYYTLDGISRTINLSASKFNPANTNLSRSYTMNEYDASVVYGIPLGQERGVTNRGQLGFGYQSTDISLKNSALSNQVASFVNQHGRHFQQLNLITGISRDSRDKDIFPTRGVSQSLGINFFLPVAERSLAYYMSFYTAKAYLPLTSNDKFIATARTSLGYGNGFSGVANYPFFKNYYAGGIDSIRGFESNTLGPKDTSQNSTGGNALVSGSIGLVFPNGLSDSFRTTWFVDAGNVYNTFDNRKFQGNGSGPLRYSTGIEADWLSPLGIIDLSVAKPLNLKRSNQKGWGDSQEIFQFSLGANFG